MPVSLLGDIASASTTGGVTAPRQAGCSHQSISMPTARSSRAKTAESLTPRRRRRYGRYGRYAAGRASIQDSTEKHATRGGRRDPEKLYGSETGVLLSERHESVIRSRT
jgi:hypothetical protein